MKFTKIIILTLLLNSFGPSNLYAQNDSSEKIELLKGLSLATDEYLEANQIMLDGESFPVYNVKGERLRGQKIMEALMSGDFTPDFYLDDNLQLKASMLRATTAEERKMMEKMFSEMNGESELVDTVAPPFSATDINGNEYSLESLKGKIIVLNFWFVKCKPCVQEMPELNELVETYKNKDVVFLGFGTNDKSKINTFLETNKFSYAIIPNSKPIVSDYMVSSYPTHIIIDKNSNIVYKTAGLSETTVKDIDNTIKSLMN